jgi:hypothetical protein
MSAARAAAQPCTIEADDATIVDVVVRPPGHAPFRIDARVVHASVTPARRAGVPRVRVEGLLAFDAAGEVPLRPGGPLSLHDGSVRLTENARILRYRAHRDGIAGRVEIAQGVTGVLVLPCSALTIDEPIRPVTTTPSAIAGASVWVPRARSVVVRPLGAPSLPLAFSADFGHALPFEVVRRSGTELLVAVEWTDGTRITGWTSRAGLRPALASGWGGTADWGAPRCGARGTCGGPNVYCGPATIAEGTPVATEPGGRAWATVRDAQRELHVHVVRRSGVARITWLPDVSIAESCDSAPPAYVPEAAVRIP